MYNDEGQEMREMQSGFIFMFIYVAWSKTRH